MCLYAGWNPSAVHVHACLSAQSPARGRPKHQLGEVTEKRMRYRMFPNHCIAGSLPESHGWHLAVGTMVH
jgi:hypothetical protein